MAPRGPKDAKKRHLAHSGPPSSVDAAVHAERLTQWRSSVWLSSVMVAQSALSLPRSAA